MFGMFLNVEEVSPSEVYSKMKNGQSPLILDVREPQEYDQIRIENSLLIPRGNLETGNLANYSKEASALEGARQGEIVVICRSGQRSLYATNYLKQQGYKNVKSMRTGVLGWAQNGYPVTGSAVNPQAESSYTLPSFNN